MTEAVALELTYTCVFTMLSHFHSTDDDDDDCQFVECLNIYGKAMFMIHTRAVSLPDVKKQKTQTEEKTKRWTVVQSLV